MMKWRQSMIGRREAGRLPSPPGEPETNSRRPFSFLARRLRPEPARGRSDQPGRASDAPEMAVRSGTEASAGARRA